MSVQSDLEALGLVSKDYEDLSVTSATVVTLTKATIDLYTNVVIAVDGGDIRFTRNGTDPTSSYGLVVFNRGTIGPLGQAEARLAKFLSTSSATVTLHVEYYLPKDKP